MRRKTKLIIAILLVILIGLLVIIAGVMFFGNDSTLNKGDKNILVCAIDESEKRPGMGACDMAFMIHLKNGKIESYTPIYPHGLTHPTVAEPEEYQQMGAGSKLLLHDSYYWNDTPKCMNYAKEIVKANTNMSADAVVAINSEALDAVIKSAGTLEVNGQNVNASGIDFIREEQNTGGDTRGQAVLNVGSALANAADNPQTRSNMITTALEQYSKGNIVMEPQGEFVNLLASKGLSSLFGNNANDHIVDSNFTNTANNTTNATTANVTG